MKILIDIDDTISNFSEILLKYLNLEYKTNYKKNDISNWEWLREHFKNPWTPTETYYFWNEVEIDKNAVKCIENLVKNGHEVYFVTSSYPSDTLGFKIRKTLSNFNKDLIDVKDVIICHNKNMVKGDIRIDDGIHNLYDGSINILVNQPWNQSKTDDFNNKYIRVNSWEDIEKVLNQIFHTKNYIRL